MTHEWVRVEGETATIGITDYAQRELGDIVFVEAPEVGRALQVGERFGTVESVKTVSDLYAPVAGEVTEVNPGLGSQSELLNADPYGGGWIIKVRLGEASGVDRLIDAAAYQATLQD